MTDPLMQTIISQATQDTAYYNSYWESLNVTTQVTDQRGGPPGLTRLGAYCI